MSRGQQRGMYEDTHTHTKALAHTDTRGAGKRVYPKGAELWHFESGQSALCNNVAPSSQTFKLSNIKDAVLGFFGLIAHKSAQEISRFNKSLGNYNPFQQAILFSSVVIKTIS